MRKCPLYCKRCCSDAIIQDRGSVQQTGMLIIEGIQVVYLLAVSLHVETELRKIFDLEGNRKHPA